MSIQIKNVAFPDIPESDIGYWIPMQYDYNSSIQMKTPGSNPETDGYPAKPGIIRNDEANIYISAMWPDGLGNPIWGKIPFNKYHNCVMTKQTCDASTGYSGSTSWVTDITAATTSNYQSNTLNKYSPPYIAELSASTTYLRYVYGLFWTSDASGATIQTRTETLKTILNNKKMPTITVGGATFVAAKVFVYKKNPLIDRGFVPATIYDVCFDNIISATNTKKYVVIRITVTEFTSTPYYTWNVYFDDGKYILDTIIPQYYSDYPISYSQTPNDFFKSSNNSFSVQHQEAVLNVITRTGKSYISGYGLGSTNNENAYTQINKGSSTVCMHSPGLCCWLCDSLGDFWFPIRQLHSRTTLPGKSIVVEGNARWAPVYNTIIEFQNQRTGELMTIELVRDDIYTMSTLNVGVTGTLRWAPAVNTSIIYKEI